MLIANAGRKYALILSMMKDLGTRPIELTWLKVKDIDLERGTVNITTAKYGKGRTLKLKENTLAMLKTYISEHKLSLNDRLFPIKSESLAESYRRLRNKLAEKLGDLTFKAIRLYDFRHWKATMTYHKTKDLLYVKSMLGHRNIRSTLRYTQLIDFGEDEWHSAVAKTVEEARQLIEQGFEYVTEIDGVKLFRKRK
jgi:integrase